MANDVKALIEAVEAGTDWISALADTAFANKEHAVLACRAYGNQGQPGTEGSLDAAKALLGVQLPGWLWSKTPLGKVDVLPKDFSKCFTGHAVGNEARSLLLAILHARAHAQEAGL